MTQKNLVKENLALAYKILAHLKLDDLTYAHLSARSEDRDSYYIYPFGLLFEEVKASSLLKVSLGGDILEGTEHQYNTTGYTIHASIYQHRPDLGAIFHLHTPATVAVSALEKGLEPLSQWALHFYEGIAYHAYDSLTLDKTQGENLVKDLGDKNVMLMRHHGMLTCGKTIHEALFYTYHLEMACKTQVMLQSTHQPFFTLSAPTCQKSVSDLLSFEKDLGKRDWEAWARKLS